MQNHSDFVAADGTVWHIFAGLPEDYRSTGERVAGEGPQAGLTFRSNTGEVRVLPRAAIPMRVGIPTTRPAPGTKVSTPRVASPDWEALLRNALPWPPG